MKEKMHFDIVINAPVQKVWDVMLQAETFKQWTTAFNPTSYYEGSWDKGSKIKFLSASGDGMISEIAENIPHKFISIKLLGEIKNGTVTDWQLPGFENYTFTEMDGHTQLQIDSPFDMSPELNKEFEAMWPKALLKLKEICEK